MVMFNNLAFKIITATFFLTTVLVGCLNTTNPVFVKASEVSFTQAA